MGGKGDKFVDVFEQKIHISARRSEELRKLEEDAVIRLPVVEALNKKIKAIEAEAEEAWDYFQKMLN